MKTLIVIAHADDEALWFSSVLLREDPEIICVTSGRNREDSKKRKEAFKKAMKLIGVKNYSFLNYPDTEERLDVEKLKRDLRGISKNYYDRVFTHGLNGDTHNHPHHQDVSYVVHQIFKNVYSTAWNQYPEVVNQLTPEEFLIKKYLIGTFYYQEYDLLKDAYEISAIEKFSKFSKESSEIFYYSIANFGDNHEYLGYRYKDFWGYKNSPYEIDRHQAIVEMTKRTSPKNILEFGSCEGILTSKLNEIAPISCIEKSITYKKVLEKKGFNLVNDANTENYELSVVASFLEYLKDPDEFLNKIKSDKVIIDVILDSNLDKRIRVIMKSRKLVAEEIIRPRWEKMYWGTNKEKLEVYRLGSHVYLYGKK